MTKGYVNLSGFSSPCDRSNSTKSFSDSNGVDELLEYDLIREFHAKSGECVMGELSNSFRAWWR